METKSVKHQSPMVWPFPKPGPRLRLAYAELDQAENGTPEQKKALGSIADLQRPWLPATCTDPRLRTDLWQWLDAVVVWLNHEMVFDTVDVIPACWPQHPHLIHELAVLVDGRYRACHALVSGPMEEWHRYALPAFLERMRHRIEGHCTDAHPATWPASGRFKRHLNETSTALRGDSYASDLDSHRKTEPPSSALPRLSLVEREKGEIVT